MKRNKIIAVDFDGTLCEHKFPEIGGIGKTQKNVIEFIRNQKESGAIIILWTCRCDTEERNYLSEAIEWCKENNIPIDYANENCPAMKKVFGCDTRKVVANMYIDDLAINANHILG